MTSPVETAVAADALDAPALLPLSALTPDHRPVTGAKALHLGTLARAGFPVPEGFCITSDALGGPPGSRLPAPLRRQIVAARQQLPPGPVAVRSSATEEDGASASWAGLFTTHLNITTEAQLLAAVLDCWRSLESDTVTRFRTQQRTAKRPAMAVIVQCQIDASAAGVLFTRDPLHPRQTHLCVNAIQGLGEPLVSGQQRGDRYRLAPNGACLERQLQCQEWRLGPQGAHPLPPERGSRSSLSLDQLRQLATVGSQLQQLFGAPQDIEFAFEGEHLWLLQSRPIVTAVAPDSNTLARYRKEALAQLRHKLAQLQEKGVLRHAPGVLSNGNIGELLPLPTPMSFALFRHIFTGDGGAIPRGRKALGYRPQARATRELFTLVAGQPYFHLELDARTYDLRRPQPVPYYLEAVRQSPARANYPEYGLYLQCPDAAEACALLGTDEGLALAQDSRRHYDAMVRFGRDYLRRYQRRIEPELKRHRLSTERCAPGATGQALLIRINALIQHLQQVSCYHFVIAARLGFYFAERLRQRLQRWLPDAAPALMAQLLQALPGSLITEQILDLAALQRGELREVDFVARYGHLAVTELEIALPRYHEAPEQLQRLAQAYAERADSRQQFRQQLRERKGVERELRLQLNAKGVCRSEQQQLFRDLRLARRFLPLRETIKYHFAAEYDLLRRALLAYATITGIEADDLFYLEPAELPLALNRRSEAYGLIDRRRHEHRLAKALAATQPLAPVIFGDRLEEAFTEPPAGGGNQWQGEGIAPGIRRGRLRLVDESSDLSALARSLHPDDILVTRSANLGLAPLLRQVAGLVVEIGGFLAHAACQAREAGIPAMVLPDATRLLRDGEQAQLDGQQGILRMASG